MRHDVEDQELRQRPHVQSNIAPGITGIFYHPSFSRRSYLTAGQRLADFPAALDLLLRHPQVQLLECPLATDEQILRVHSPALIPDVEADPF